MESVTELPTYVNYTRKNCDHKWKSEALTKNCPECNGEDIDHVAMTRGF